MDGARGVVICGDAKIMLTQNEPTIITLTGTSYAYYNAGIAKGKLDTLNECIGQLVSAAEHYKSQGDQILNAEPFEKDGNKYIKAELFQEVIDSFGLIPNQIRAVIPDSEKEFKKLLDTAIKLEEKSKHKPFSQRIVDAIDGFVAGWNA